MNICCRLGRTKQKSVFLFGSSLQWRVGWSPGYLKYLISRTEYKYDTEGVSRDVICPRYTVYLGECCPKRCSEILFGQLSRRNARHYYYLLFAISAVLFHSRLVMSAQKSPQFLLYTSSPSDSYNHRQDPCVKKPAWESVPRPRAIERIASV